MQAAVFLDHNQGRRVRFELPVMYLAEEQTEPASVQRWELRRGWLHGRY